MPSSAVRASAAIGLALGFALAASACSLLLDSGSLSGGANPGPSADASSETDGSVSPPRACRDYPTPPLVCDDFDDDAPLSARWRVVFAKSGGRCAKEERAALGGPRGFLSSVPRVAETSMAHLRTPFATLSRKIRYDFDLFVAETPGDGDKLQANRLSFGNVSVNFEVLPDGGASLNTEVGGQFQPFPLPALGRNVWRHVTIDLEVRGSVGRVWVMFDRNVVLRDTAIKWPVKTDGTGDAIAGITYLDPNEGPWAIYLDNVAVTEVPE